MEYKKVPAPEVYNVARKKVPKNCTIALEAEKKYNEKQKQLSILTAEWHDY